MGWGSLGPNVAGIWGPELVLFFFYVSVSGLRSRLSFQPLTIPAPWVLLCVGWSITLWPPWVTALRGIERLS